MRDILLDVIKQANGLVEVLKVTGSDKETRLQAVDDKMTLFIEATLNTPVPEFTGEFGLTNLGLLKRLLEFSSYRTDKATFNVKRFEADGKSAPELFEFKDETGVGKSVFRLMNAKSVPDQAEIRNIPWDVTFKANRSKIAEFQELAGIYSEVDKFFSTQVDAKGNLIFTMGDDTSSTHYASVVVETGVTGTLKGDAVYSIGQFLSVLKIAGTGELDIKITGRGVLSVEVPTAYGLYKYYLRAATR